MVKKKVAVVMSGTDDLSFAMANVIIGLNKYSPDFVDDVIIYHQNISESDKLCLSKLTSCRFIDYKGHPAINDMEESENIKKYSMMSFAIYEIFKHLDEYEFVIYLDADLLIQKDISDIVQFTPIAMAQGRLTINEACGRNVISDETVLYAKSSGVVVINDTLKSGDELTESCYLKTAELWNDLVFPDQAIINYVMYENGITINDLPRSFNAGKASKNLHEAKIVHTQGGKSKFWNNGVTNIMFPEWNRNNDIWLSLGGAAYKGPRYYWSLHGMSQTRLFEIIKEANARGVSIK